MKPEQRLARIIADCEQNIIDINYWNGINPKESPIDIEPERVIAAKAREATAAYERGDRVAGDRISRTVRGYAEGVFDREGKATS